MSGKFSKKNSQRYVVVHRPHDDPNYYDAGRSQHVFVPVEDKNAEHRARNAPSAPAMPTAPAAPAAPAVSKNENAGTAALYGIEFDDSKYDYTKHLRPIGANPDSVFIPSKTSAQGGSVGKKQNIEDLFVEPGYKEEQRAAANVKPRRIMPFGNSKENTEYLKHQQDVTDDIKGFRPDMNPALREVLEALEDEAYVVNDDIVVKRQPKTSEGARSGAEAEEDDEDDIFAELMGGGEAVDEDEFAEEFDEWDNVDYDNYEDEKYQTELNQFDKLDNLEDLTHIDYQTDVRRFQAQSKLEKEGFGSDNDFDSDEEEQNEGEEEEEQDAFGDLPGDIQLKSAKNNKKSKRKERRKKGAMSDISGFSMSSSAIARTETMTVLDDKYENIIGGYENYEEEQEEDENENYKPFDMTAERPDFESMLDDFLDNYELEGGGRKLVKKDEELQKFKDAADEVSKGKLSKKRNLQKQQQKEKSKSNVNTITNSLTGLTL
ncbi:ribosome biogenesis protein LTV1 KNAG_0H02230 [Huiozyma naganishii CBS 8797]|uniref:Protein LTV1 n=1 Tax=Huiozyma naganishii (strain ATCC MYA-139 / BCRC 22969 / CBS 8797 / KCTC 17520 / NBRC 10181 / NCYC 3082 / Yp74L-3) TaxID=1071383 RepID=J7S1U1_HUIN7|nr:hypothetical protein KNAG_0H02230 [Kazachstania naganishii CBS 8797]CCK71637.1 hypothetical protein KNAG_0H02230 [Kazachstania naganishii CBS 8797]